MKKLILILIFLSVFKASFGATNITLSEKDSIYTYSGTSFFALYYDSSSTFTLRKLMWSDLDTLIKSRINSNLESSVMATYFLDDTSTTNSNVLGGTIAAPAPTALTKGMMVKIETGVAASGSAVTLAFNGLTAKSVKSLHDVDPATDYFEAGSIIIVIYDGTLWQIQTPDANP